MQKWKIRLTKSAIKRRFGGKLIPSNGELIHHFRLPDGTDLEYFVFDSSVTNTPGVTTPLNVVAVHKIVAEQPRLLEVVAIHEAAHTKQWYRYFVDIVLWLSLSWFLFFGALGIQNVGIGANKSLLIAFLLFVAFVLYSWLLEYLANVAAINAVGINRFQAVFSELYQMMNMTKSQRMMRFLTHPPVTVHVWLYRATHR